MFNIVLHICIAVWFGVFSLTCAADDDYEVSFEDDDADLVFKGFDANQDLKLCM